MQEGNLVSCFLKEHPAEAAQGRCDPAHTSVTIKERCLCAPQQNLETRRWEHPATTLTFSCWVTAQKDGESAFQAKIWEANSPKGRKLQVLLQKVPWQAGHFTSSFTTCKEPKQQSSQSRHKLTQLFLSPLLAHRDCTALGRACTTAHVSAVQGPWRIVFCYPNKTKNQETEYGF